MPKKQPERIVFYVDEYGEAMLYVTKATYDLLARITTPYVYSFVEDATGEDTPYEVNIELWSNLPAKLRKRITESEE